MWDAWACVGLLVFGGSFEEVVSGRDLLKRIGICGLAFED